MEKKPVHPGEVFLEDVLSPMDMGIDEAAQRLGISETQFVEFVSGNLDLTEDLARTIASWTKTSSQSWMLMQKKLNAWKAQPAFKIY